jgi:PAS domain S-box-containing protein
MGLSSTELELSTALRLLEETQRMAKIGGWELDVPSGNLYWTAETYRILDTSPQEFIPTVDAVVDYFLPESKKKLQAAIDAALSQGLGFDLQLETYTTKGRKIDIRVTCKVTAHEGEVSKLTGGFHDISESVSQQKEIEQNHRRLQVATDAAELGVWEYNILEQSLIWDKRMYELYGVTADQFNAVYSFWENALSPQDMKKASQAISDAIKNKKSFKIEFSVPHPDGSLHWIAATGCPIEDASGQVVKVIGTNQSIDSIKEYEERIEMSHKFANTGYWDWNFKSGVVYWSPTIVKMYGGTETNLITSHENFVSALHPDDRQFVQDAVNLCIDSGDEYNIQHRIVWPDGSVHWIAAQGNVVRNSQGEVERMLGMAQDITQRKQIEDELLTQSQIVTRMGEGANLVRVSDRTIVYTNPAFEKMFAYEPGEMLGKHISITNAPGHVSPKSKTQNIINELEANRVWRGEVHNIKKDGTIFWTYATVSTFDHPEYGKVWLSVQTDITERKLRDKQLRHSQKMDTIGQLTGGIAHDFNNILAIVSGNLELLQRMLPTDSKEYKRVDNALKGTTRGVLITRKLLNFSRQDAVDVKPTDINDFVVSSIDFIKKSLTPSIHIETNLAKDLWITEVDQGDFEDSLLNIALNAHDAMPDGGTLSITTSNQVLPNVNSLRANSPEDTADFVTISITDTGTGMSEEVRDKVLEPFFTTKDKSKGTGLGLSMVHGFVNRSGGRIEIDSVINEGSTFTLFLPRIKETVNLNCAQSIGIEYPKGNETILIVDDEEALRDLAKILLTGLGYSVLTAANGDEALEILERGIKIDLLFSDIVMPGKLDGNKLAIVAHKQQPNLKILLTSGYVHKRDDTLSENNEYLSKLLAKPYSQLELALAVHGTLNTVN